MKLFCVVFALMMTAMILIVDVLLCNWLTVNGPAWMVNGIETQPKGYSIALCGAVFAFATVVSMLCILASIDDKELGKK